MLRVIGGMVIACAMISAIIALVQNNWIGALWPVIVIAWVVIALTLESFNARV